MNSSHEISSHSISRLYPALLSLLLIIATLLLYSPVLDFQFLNFDDNEYVTENQFVTSGLTSANVRWAFTQSHSGHWHPLSWISHMLDVELFGINPGAHHAVNVVFHAFNGALAFLRRSRTPSYFKFPDNFCGILSIK